MRWAGGEDWGWCTLYLGGEEDDPEVAPGEEPRKRARAGLERGSEGEEQGVVQWATEEAARAKVQEAAEGERNMGNIWRELVDQHVAWEVGAGETVWRGANARAGAGYARLHDEVYDEAGEQIGTVRDEPLLRMLLRGVHHF